MPRYKIIGIYIVFGIIISFSFTVEMYCVSLSWLSGTERVKQL